MKRNEIKVGEEYLVGTHHTWHTGHYRNVMVKVVDTTRGWMRSRSLVAPQGRRMRETDSGILPVPYGFVDTPSRQGVLVQVLDRDGEGFAVYEPRYFRATRAEGERVVAEWRDRQRAQMERATQARDESRTRMEGLQHRAEEVGLGVRYVDPMTRSFRISADELERVVHLLESLPGEKRSLLKQS